VKNTKQKKIEQVPAERYEPTDHDRKVMQGYFGEQRENPPPPRLKCASEVEGVRTLVPDYPDASVGLVRLVYAVGLKDQTLGRQMLTQMADVANGNEDALNAMIGFVRSLEPRDSLEATLATQMAAIHWAIMTFAQRLNLVKTIPQQVSAERTLNKLARFATPFCCINKWPSRKVVAHLPARTS